MGHVNVGINASGNLSKSVDRFFWINKLSYLLKLNDLLIVGADSGADILKGRLESQMEVVLYMMKS